MSIDNRKWGCHNKDFHNLIKQKAAEKGMPMMKFEEWLAKQPDPFKEWEESLKKKKFEFRL